MIRNNLYIESGEVRAYAVRRINPFMGVLQVIETDGGRAASSNGIVWDIEMRTERPDMWGSLNKGTKEAAYYRYGLWSQDEGLINRPLAPHLERDPLTIQCNIIIGCIEERLKHLPFKLVDDRELWLFDKDMNRPIVLLASQKPDAKPISPAPKYWKSCLGANGVTSQIRYPKSKMLEDLVKRTASSNINNYWVNRAEDGGGVLEHDGQKDV